MPGDDMVANSRVTNQELRIDIAHLATAFEKSETATFKWREKMEERVRSLEDHRLTKEIEMEPRLRSLEDNNLAKKSGDTVWPFIKDKILIPAFNYGIALMLGWFFLKITGQLP